MDVQTDPWYVHAGLYLVIAILTVLLVKIAIIDPHDYVETEKYNKKESRLRMTNLKEAQMLWERKYDNYSGNIDALSDFKSIGSAKITSFRLSKRTSSGEPNTSTTCNFVPDTFSPA